LTLEQENGDATFFVGHKQVELSTGSHLKEEKNNVTIFFAQNIGVSNEKLTIDCFQ